jgi:hypothetical protein
MLAIALQAASARTSRIWERVNSNPRDTIENIHGNVNMHGFALPFRPDECKKNLELIDTPVKHLCKHPKAKALQTFIHANVKIGSGFAKTLVLWPRPKGHFERGDADVYETCFFHLLLHNLRIATSGHTLGINSLFPKPLPFLKSAIRGHAAVIRTPMKIEFLVFDPAAWSQGGEGLPVKLWPGANTETVHETSVDEIKTPGHVPVFLSIGDLKLEVGRDKVRLDRGEVCTDNMAPG